MTDNDILLGGYGLFGGRGEYTAKIRLYDIGPDGGEQEGDGEILAETEEIAYECGARQKFPVLFDEPVMLQANRWYVAWARISGPSSDCGSSGQSVVSTEDQLIFYFKSSKKSNNGTDVNAGQIPQLLYKVCSTNDVSSQGLSSRINSELSEDSNFIVSREFYLNVTPDSFCALLKLLKWSWQSFKTNINDLNLITSSSPTTLSCILIDLKHLAYIACVSLNLIKIYVNEIFPNTQRKLTASSSDSFKLAECVYDARTLINQIFLEPPTFPPKELCRGAEFEALISQIMEECHEAFLSCYHAFYPSNSLRWTSLCELLSKSATDKNPTYLLSANLAALCSPWIRLTQTLPLFYNSDNSSLQSPSDAISPSSGKI